jgi:phospholipid/cholesterol/gamma-HCH transport system substrate-binding protein
MDKKITNNIVLGVFVIIGFSLFVFLIFNIGGGSGLFTSQFHIYGKFAHVKGLHLGSEVSLSGLRVGTVKEITVSNDKEKGLVVELAVSKKIQDKIRTDSFAKIVTQGVLGDKYIELTIGSPENPMLNDGDIIATQEVVDLFTKSGGLVDNIAKQFNSGGEVETLIKNLNHVAENLTVITTDLQRSKGLYHELVSGTNKRIRNPRKKKIQNKNAARVTKAAKLKAAAIKKSNRNNQE